MRQNQRDCIGLLVSHKYLKLWVLVLFVMLLAACSPQTVEVIKTVEVEKVITESAEKPAETQASPPPATQPSSTSTPVPQPVIYEAHLVELEWPAELRLGESDLVRLSLIPNPQGYTLKSEFPEHQLLGQDVQINRPPGYELWATARLDAAGFVVSPNGDQARWLPPGQELTWRWSLTAEHAGRKRLSVRLALRWVPTPGSGNQLQESEIFSRSLEIQIRSFLGLQQSQAFFLGLASLVLGSGLGIFGLSSGSRRKSQILPLMPNQTLQIEAPASVRLSNAESTLLRALFKRYARLIIENEFLSGYSGARTLLLHPIHSDGRADAHTIAKLGTAESIEQEFGNYEAYVKDTLPPITARIQHPPVRVAQAARLGASQLAAIQYTFITGPGSQPRSLRQVLLEDDDPQPLQTLFETFGPNWWMQRKPYSFRLAQEYDPALPSHLIVAPVTTSEGPVQRLDLRTPPGEISLMPGDFVQLGAIARAESRPGRYSLSLRGTAVPGHPPLRVRWNAPALNNSLLGQVISTRKSSLAAFCHGFDPHGFPDPLMKLDSILNESVQGTQCIVHGDLNLENILAGPGKMVWLIDFAQTRTGHSLLDFAHLGAELVAHIFAPQVSNTADLVDLLANRPTQSKSRLQPLWQTLETVAKQCLFNPTDTREWQLALTISLIGAIKYDNLDVHARHCLYLAAAITSSML